MHMFSSCCRSTQHSHTSVLIHLIDRVWMIFQLSDVKILKITSSLSVRSVENNRHQTNEFIIIEIYLSDQKDRVNVIVSVRRKLHVIDDLRANMLIDNDIIDFERITLDIVDKTVHIANCEVDISVQSRQRERYQKHVISVEKTTVISSHVERFAFINVSSMSADRNFIFESKVQSQLSMYSHSINSTMTSVLMFN